MDTPPTFSGGSGRAKHNKTRIGIVFYTDGDKESLQRIVEATQEDESTVRALKEMWEASDMDKAITISKRLGYSSCDTLIAGKFDTVVYVPEALTHGHRFQLLIGFALDKRFGLQYLLDVFTGGVDMQGASRHFEAKLHCKDGVAVVYSPSAAPTGGTMNGQQIKSLTNWHEFSTFIGYKKWDQKYVRRMWNTFVVAELRTRNRYQRRPRQPGEPAIDPDSDDD
jgi:hypothetical protein